MKLSLVNLIATVSLMAGQINAQTCTDMEGWVDQFGDDCEWYVTVGECYEDGNYYPDEDGVTAQIACCACGGGSVDGVPYLDRCEDFSGFTDCSDDPCSSYETWELDPDEYSYLDDIDEWTTCSRSYLCPNSETSIDAEEACCICGGGTVVESPRDDESEDEPAEPDEPTASPTPSPTEEPTPSPTKEPTSSPSKGPTAAPTVSPAPTISPAPSLMGKGAKGTKTKKAKGESDGAKAKSAKSAKARVRRD